MPLKYIQRAGSVILFVLSIAVAAVAGLSTGDSPNAAAVLAMVLAVLGIFVSFYELRRL